MSYVRWSDESDVYVYEHYLGGISISVASRRVNGNPPDPLDALTGVYGVQPNERDKLKAMTDEYQQLRKDREDYIAAHGYEDLTKLGGEDRVVLYYEDAVDYLLDLRDRGYRVPQYVIDTMYDELDWERRQEAQ